MIFSETLPDISQDTPGNARNASHGATPGGDQRAVEPQDAQRSLAHPSLEGWKKMKCDEAMCEAMVQGCWKMKNHRKTIGTWCL